MPDEKNRLPRTGLTTSPGNENEVGLGIKDSGVPREEIFLTSKLWNTHHPNVKEGLQKTLDSLGVNYLDLYVSLRHPLLLRRQNSYETWTDNMNISSFTGPCDWYQ